MFFMFDYYYFILVVPALLIVLWTQGRVAFIYQKYGRIPCRRGISGAEAARSILDSNGLYDVSVQRIDGELSDHYDPHERIVRLSAGVYDSDSLAAVGITAHEVGHALQYSERYLPIRIRTAIIPATNIGARFSIPLILVGLLFGIGPLISLGILLFALSAFFQIVTLPVEFDASTRAMAAISEHDFLEDDEKAGARRVLSVAALTYVATLLVAMALILRLLLFTRNRRR